MQSCANGLMRHKVKPRGVNYVTVARMWHKALV